MKEKIIELVEEILRVPAGTVTETTMMEDVEQWDSLAQVMIIGELEERLGISVSLEDAMDITGMETLLEKAGFPGKEKPEKEGRVTLRPIEEADLENIMRWRMDEEITRYMNTNPKLTPEGQRKWLASIRNNPDVRYWIIQVDGIPAGVINLTGLENPEGNLGWAYYIGEKRLRSLKSALSLEMSMYDYIFGGLGKKAVYADVFTLNQGVIRLHKMCGCEIVEEKKSHVHKEGVAYDVTFMRMTAERWERIRGGKQYEKIDFGNGAE